jgi:hypothetical protein
VQKYKGSLAQMLHGVFPDQTWFPWKFKGISKGIWERANNLRLYFDWLIDRLDLEGPEQLIRSQNRALDIKGALLQSYTLQEALGIAYPGLLPLKNHLLLLLIAPIVLDRNSMEFSLLCTSTFYSKEGKNWP